MTNPSDTDIRALLTSVRTIAVVGFSANADRPSHYVAEFLQARGYRIVPVNPGLAGQVFLGEVVYPDLASIPSDLRIDMVDIFRRSEDVPAVVDAAIASLPTARVIWMQMGIRNETAAMKARARGMTVVQDRCPKVEIPRLGL